MLNTYIELLMQFHRRKTNTVSQVISLSLGTLFFLFILPGIFFLVASLTGISFDIHETIQTPLAVLAICVGLYFLIWATYAQFTIGGGTPAPNAPTHTLVILGPYKYTRNPIEFGALWYYLGVGTLLGSLFHGTICLLLGFIFGSFYHKCVEEKELVLRFGKAYEEYRKETPFLIPTCWRKKRT